MNSQNEEETSQNKNADQDNVESPITAEPAAAEEEVAVVKAAPPIAKSTEKKEEQIEDEGEESSIDARPKQVKFTRPRNVEELMLQALPERTKFASQNLKNIVSSSVLFDLMPSGKKYLYEPQSGSVSIASPASAKATCTIQIHEKDLMKIADGDLNPQVLMLSHKAKVSGNTQIATYVFNLIAPANNF